MASLTNLHQRSIPLLVTALIVTVLVVAACAARDTPRSGEPAVPTRGLPSSDTNVTTEQPSTRADSTATSALPEAQISSRKAPIANFKFSNIADETGFKTAHSSQPLDAEFGMTSGAAVDDIDNDGDLDIFLPRIGLGSSLYLNDGHGRFDDIAVASGLAAVDNSSARSTSTDDLGGFATAAIGDFDADDDMDIIALGANHSASRYFVNDGALHFTDEAAIRGVSLPPLNVADGPSQNHGISAQDFDRDGDLDLVITHWDSAAMSASPSSGEHTTGAVTCRNTNELRALGFPRQRGAPPNRGRILRNDGHGMFSDATATLGVNFEHMLSFTATFADLDGDGWDDLFLVGDACTTRLYRNVGGQRFVDITDESGVGTDENGMGTVVRDVDGDGDLDWFITSIAYPTADGTCPIAGGVTGCSGNRLYRNTGDGTFEDATDEFGVRNGWWGWGAAIEDFANDGQLEIAQTNGFFNVAATPRGQLREASTIFFDQFDDDPMRFWVPTNSESQGRVSQGRGLASSSPRFTDVAGAVGLTDRAVGHALVAFDSDRDGDLDLLVAASNTVPLLYRNESTKFRGVSIRLNDPTRPGNRFGVGAIVTVHRMDGTSVSNHVSTSGSYESHRPPEVHVGLAGSAIESVDVTWPGSSQAQRTVPDSAATLITINRES